MAIIIYGMECVLCGRPIVKGQEIVSFSPFIANELDPLSIFTDGAFHAECFHNHPLAEKAQSRYKEMRERNGPGSRICVVCKREITDPDDYFTMGYLVDDEYHPLHRYNYTQAHRTHLSKWAEMPYVYELVEDLKQSGTWRGEALDELLAELRAALPSTLHETAR